METSILIYMVENDNMYAKTVKDILAKNHYKNFVVFEDEKECLAHMSKKPDILISGYHLTDKSGLQLIKRAKSMYPNLFSILLSGDFQNETVFDKRFLQYVDKYIIKGMDDIEELIEAVTYNFA